MAAAAAAASVAVASLRQQIACIKETALKNIETNIDQASVYIRTGDIDDPAVYSRTCMKLGSSIDSAIAVNASPSSSYLPRLVLVVKEVYKRKTDILQPSLMLLMLPIKAACRIGWFLEGDKAGFLMIAKELSYGFTSTDKMNIEPSNAHSSVSSIVSRFYPTMKVERILTSFDVKAGYGTFVADFHISLGATPRNCRNLWLLVAQLDNMETAACITNPLNVDFLINGCAVPNRTKNNMEKGPQLPSNMNKMIKYGTNLLQVFGDFDGQYIIALAFMNSIPPDPSQLQDYLRPMSDCAIIDMSTRISLYCPISQHRINTPVKGHLCKHPQCFDYNHFIEVNSVKPTWTCPLCNNPVCNQDLRIDQDFFKILNEVAEDVHDVIISEDGSWMVAETEDKMSCSTVTTPAVSCGQTPVNLCTKNQAENTTGFTPSAGSLGQTQVDACTTNQGQTQVNACTTMFTPPAAVIKLEVSPGQTQVNTRTTNQAQSTTMFTPPAAETKPAVSPGQTQVNACTTNQGNGTTMFTPPAAATKPAVSPGQTQVNACTTNQGKSKTMFTPPAAITKPAVSPGQTQVNACTTNQGNGTTMFTPPAAVTKPAVSPGQTQVNACTTNQGKSTTMFTPPAAITKPAVSPGQTQVNAFTTNQGQSTTMFTPPAAITKPAVSPGQTQVNACTTNQGKSTTMLTPPADVTKPAVSPGQTQVNACTTNQGKSTTMFTPPAAVTRPAVSPAQTQVNACTTNQGKSTTMFTPPVAKTKPAVSPGQTQVNAFTTNQGQSTTMFTPSAAVIKPEDSPGQTQVTDCTTTQAKHTTMLTPPEGSPDQIRVDVCASNQGRSTTFTPPATVKEPPVSPGQTQVNICTTTQTVSTPMFAPPAFTSPNISQVLPTQLLEATGDGMPSGRMRGSLRGDKLEAARLQYLAPPQQPTRANEPWSRPPVPSLSLPFMMPKPPANSDHV